jgi:tellurite resistance-related uncharacterized protein
VRHLSLSQTNALHEGLIDRLGINVIPSQLPPGLEIYARSPDFVPATLPADLRAAHCLAEGAFGVIRVLEGAVLFALESPATSSIVLRPGESAVIEPQRLHHLLFVEPGRFFIEFHISRERLKARSQSGTC